MRRFLLPLLAALALPTAVNSDQVVAKEGYLASSPAPPFTDPPSVRIPEGFPFNTVRPQLFKRAYWLDDGFENTEIFRGAGYVGETRRSGNIVSIMQMLRTQTKNKPPNYTINIVRYDCANDSVLCKCLCQVFYHKLLYLILTTMDQIYYTWLETNCQRLAIRSRVLL